MRTTSPQLPLLPSGALDEVKSEHMRGSLKSRISDVVTGDGVRQLPWPVLVLGAD